MNTGTDPGMTGVEDTRLTWVTGHRAARLHLMLSYRPSAAFETSYPQASLACGRTVPLAHMPGVATRLTAPRCRACCRSSGLPQGVGSPLNDIECRRLLGVTRPTGRRPDVVER
jgi:hypothetical protein